MSHRCWQVMAISPVLWLSAPVATRAAEFIRGDANHDGTVSISDAATLAQYFFIGGDSRVVWQCLDAADTEDDGKLDIMDLQRILELLFGDGPVTEPRPFPLPFGTPGPDLTADTLSCDEPTGPSPQVNPAFVIEVGSVPALAGQVVTVPVYGTTPVEVDAFSLALAYDPAKLQITGFTFAGTIYEALGLVATMSRWGGPDGGGWYGESTNPVCRDFVAAGTPYPDLTCPELVAGEYILGVLNAIGHSVRLPPLARDVLVNLRVEVMPGIAGLAVIAPQSGLGSPPVSNEYSVIGQAAYAATYPILLGGGATVTPTTVGRFRRADVNADGRRDISDAVGILAYLFLGASTPGCLDAADTDDSGAIEITDAIALLGYLFNGYPRSLPEPFVDCGADLTEDPLGLCLYAASCGDV